MTTSILQAHCLDQLCAQNSLKEDKELNKIHALDKTEKKVFPYRETLKNIQHSNVELDKH